MGVEKSVRQTHTARGNAHDSHASSTGGSSVPRVPLAGMRVRLAAGGSTSRGYGGVRMARGAKRLEAGVAQVSGFGYERWTVTEGRRPMTTSRRRTSDREKWQRERNDPAEDCHDEGQLGLWRKERDLASRASTDGLRSTPDGDRTNKAAATERQRRRQIRVLWV